MSPLGAQSGTAYSPFLTKDYTPAAVARGGAVSTFSGDASSILYNPSLAALVGKESGFSLDFSHAFLPVSVYMDQAGLFWKSKLASFYFSFLYFASDIHAVNAANDEYGDINAQTFFFTLSMGNLYFFPS